MSVMSAIVFIMNVPRSMKSRKSDVAKCISKLSSRTKRYSNNPPEQTIVETSGCLYPP